MSRPVPINLDDMSDCPLGERCDRCGGTYRLGVALTGSALGVGCYTLCAYCAASCKHLGINTSALVVAEHVNQHCVHLGVDLDEMADAMAAENQWGAR